MKRIILVFFILIQAMSAQSAGVAFVFENYQDQIIYQETLQQCQQSHSLFKTLVSKNNWDAFIISTGQSFDLLFNGSNGVQKYQHMSQQNMLSDYSVDRLKSMGFVRALSECYPGDNYMQSAFIYSMITADTVGKIPSVLTLLYSFKGSNFVWSKFATKFPVASKVLQTTAVIGGLILAVTEARTSLKNRELSDFEKERVKKISEGMKTNVEATKSLVVEMANEEIAIQEKAYAEATSLQEKEKILLHINKIKAAMKKV